MTGECLTPRACTRARIADIATRHGVAPDEVMGSSRRATVSRARQAVMADLRARGWSSVKIGRLLHRHHTTVLHGIAAHEARSGRLDA
jgi:chromosomal replication initiation ATPase DnaA